MNLPIFPCIVILYTYLYASQHFSHLSTSHIHCVIQTCSLHNESSLCSVRTLHCVSSGPSWEWIWGAISTPQKLKEKKATYFWFFFFMPIETFCSLPHVYHRTDICPQGEVSFCCTSVYIKHFTLLPVSLT